ncbi:MAG TPA: peptidylprolyl isomerase [Pirellulaceae bacterium]|nr:peptidylprolyl isomerase [Pirellulaceae bacterium]
MTSLESTPAAGRMTHWLGGLFTLLAVAAVAVALRTFQGPPEASAQAPVKTPAGQSLTPLAKRPSAAAQQSAAPAKGTATRVKAPAAPLPASSLKVMAVVNSEPISREQLGHECLRRYGEEVLESLVNMQLINEALQSRGISITKKDIDGEIDRIAAKFGLPRDRWLTLLRDERGFSEEQYSRDVVWPMLALRKLAAADVKVTNEELQMAFEAEYGPKVRARMIILPSLQKAQAVHAQAVADPRKFGELARQGEDPNIAAASGVIPPICLHSGSPEIEQAAFALKKGQVSNPIKVANKYVILYCEDTIPEQYPTTQQLPAIEKQLTDKLREDRIRKASAEFFARAQQSAQIVDVWNNAELRKAQPGVAATINGRPITIAALQNECVERYGSDVLEGEINRKILAQELAKRKITVTAQDLDAEIARAAESYGKFKQDGKTPDVEAWLKEVTVHDGATVELYKDDAVWPSVALKKLVGNRVQVTEDDLQKGYESSYGERVEVLAIVLGDQRQAQRVWDQARNNPTEGYFANLAAEYSIEPTSRSNGGKVPPIRRHSGGGVIEEEAFKLKPGELSGILAADDQFILLKCIGRTKPVAVDFASVKNNLYKDIHEKKIRVEMNKEFDRLLASAQVDNYLAGTSQPGRRAAAAAPASATAAGPANGAPTKKLTPIRTPAGGTSAPATATSPKTKTVR